MYNLINSRYKIHDDHEKKYLHDRYCNLPDPEKNQRDDILIKIIELQNNLLDIIWNMVNKQFKRDTKEDKTDKKKSINKYLEGLKKNHR